MTPGEFSREFDIEYNNITSNLAAPLNEYEKSVFLTKAEEQFVVGLAGSFETNERSRKILLPLLETATSAPTRYSDVYKLAVSDSSVFFLIPDDVMCIVYEEVRIAKSAGDRCLAGKVLKVFPTTHDTLQRVIDDPFIGKAKDRALRLDVSVGDSVEFGNINVVQTGSITINPVPTNDITIYTGISEFGKFSEIVYRMADLKSDADRYFIRYLRMPKPIVTVDLSQEFPGQQLMINGVSGGPSPCELDTTCHRTIVEAAAAMAVAAYKRVERSNNQ